jgi:amidase
LGSPLFKENIAHSDSIHVERIKKSGAIIIGKTNVPEFGLGSQTYNPVFGTTLNAYDGVSTAGGSSGGAAVALALKMLPVADGSDLMGSLRNPAAFNNVIGFRPTPGRVPLSGMYIEELPCNGPMGRDVRDTAMLLSTIAGYHSAAPTSLKQDSTQFAQTLKSNVTGTRIGWLGDFDGYLPMEEGVMDVCEKGLKAFSDIGCEVDKAKLGYPMEQLWATWLTFRHWLVLGKVGPLYRDPKKRPLLKPEAIWEAQGGLNLRADDVYQASVARSQWYKALLGAFEHYDFLVLPTAQVFPFDANTHWPKEIAGKTMDTYHRWMEVVVPGTLSGCPVINVPAGFGKGGLPMGLQIIGRRHADLAVLKIAYAYEQASRWNSTHSPRFL